MGRRKQSKKRARKAEPRSPKLPSVENKEHLYYLEEGELYRVGESEVLAATAAYDFEEDVEPAVIGDRTSVFSHLMKGLFSAMISSFSTDSSRFFVR